MAYRHRWRLPLVGRLAVGLVILLAGAAGCVTLAARQADQFMCLRINGTMLLDINSGVHVIDTRPADIGYPAASIYGSAISPDQKHTAYVGPGQHSTTLYIKTGPGLTTPISDRIDYVGSLIWSPDSSSLAYSWMVDHRIRLAIVRADGSDPTLISDTGDPSLYVWSSAGRYVTYLTGNVAQRRLALWSLDDHRNATLSQPLSSVSALAFDAHDQHVAFVWSDTATRRWISVGSPDQPTAKQFPLPAASYDYHLVWSPDGKFVAMQYRAQWPSWRFAVYGSDGSAVPDIAETVQASEAPADPLIVWSADSHSLTYLIQQPNQRHDLLSYNLNDGTTQTIAASLAIPPMYSPQKNRMALYSIDGLSLDVMDVDGMNRAPFIEDAASIRPILWSPDGQQIAAIWSSAPAQSPSAVKVSWMHADGTERHNLSTSFTDVPDTQWIKGSNQLAFIGVHDERYSVHLVDSKTGADLNLLDGLTQVAAVQFDTARQVLTFWWRTDQREGADGYSLDGSRAYRLPATGIFDNNSRLFWSPDGTIAAFLMGGPGGQKLELAAPGAAAPVVAKARPDSVPLWTPDSRWLAVFTSKPGKLLTAGLTLVVVRPDGTEIRRVDNMPAIGYAPSWSQCG